MAPRGIYCELLDTPWTDKHDRSAALTLLRFRALAAEPCELSTTHAISSQLILDSCSTDEYFRKLVANGRIRFRLRPNGDGPREALIAGLKRDDYRLDTWPGIGAPLDSPGWPAAKELRKAAAAMLSKDEKKRPKEAGHPALDLRLRRANELFATIERAIERVRNAGNQYPCERRHENRLLVSITTAAQGMPASRQRLAELLTRVTTGRGRVDRSELWQAIDRDDHAWDELKRDARRLVDAHYNRLMAYSLDQDLLAVDRRLPLNYVFANDEQPEACESLSEEIDDIDVDDRKQLESLAMTWKHVFSAASHIQGANVEKEDLELARRVIVDCIVSGRAAVDAGTLESLVDDELKDAANAHPVSWHVLTIGGAAASGLISAHILPALAGIAGVFGIRQITKWRTGKRKARTEAHARYWHGRVTRI